MKAQYNLERWNIPFLTFTYFVSMCLNTSILNFLNAFNREEGLLTSLILPNKKKRIFPVNMPSFHCRREKKRLEADKELFNQLPFPKRIAGWLISYFSYIHKCKLIVKCFGKKRGFVHILHFFAEIRFGPESCRGLPDAWLVFSGTIQSVLCEAHTTIQETSVRWALLKEIIYI